MDTSTAIASSTTLHHPKPRDSREPSKRLSRSPKRVKSTPPTELPSRVPLTATNTTVSTRTRQEWTATATRPSLGMRRGISYGSETTSGNGNKVEKHVQTSPCISHAARDRDRDREIMSSEWGLGLVDVDNSRRREMSVPLLSQSLSSFSLSRPSTSFGLFPTDTNEGDATPTAFGPRSMFGVEAHGTPSPPGPSSTPRREPIAPILDSPGSGLLAGLPRDHPHPSTAPLPQLPTFLGSPFSSKTAKGGYKFNSMSPSKGRIMTERIGQNGFEHLHLDWMDRSEWILDDEPPAGLGLGSGDPTSSLRRDPSSTSSIDDSCESGTSSSSLTSLGRSSGEQGRPNMVTIWGEAGLEDDDLDQGGLGQATPSRQLFPISTTAAMDALQMQMPGSKDKSSPHISPLDGKARVRQRSPLQVFFMQTPRGDSPSPDKARTPTPPSEAKMSKSSFNSLLPRLVSSRKSVKRGSSGRSQPNSCLPSPSILDMDSEAYTSRASKPTSAPSSRLPTAKSRKSLLFHTVSDSPMANSEPRRTVRFPEASPDETFGADSDAESSPSKAASSELLRTSVNSSSTAETMSNSTSSMDSPIEPARAAVLARRKTMAAQPATGKGRSTIGPSGRSRPGLRRGVTDPRTATLSSISTGEKRSSNGLSSLLSPDKTFATPVSALFGNEKPSPAAFASTGLVKKKSGTPGMTIPKFGDSEPAPKVAGLPRTSQQPVKSRLGVMVTAAQKTTAQSASVHRPHALSNSFTDESSPLSGNRHVSGASIASGKTTTSSTSSDASVSVYTRGGVAPTRGLRRKTSSMFGPSASSGSIGDTGSAGDGSQSPATPTKPGLFSVPGLGITTPSPVAGTPNVYPFAHAACPPTVTSGTSRKPSGSMPGETSSAESSPVHTHSRVSKLARTIKKPIARASNPMLAATFKLDAMMSPSTGSPRAFEKEDNKSALTVGGSRLDKDFVLVSSLGKGEFSRVWKVMEKTTGTMYAVKSGRTYTGHKNRLRQLEEVSILRQLSLSPHPHILTFVDSWEHSNRLFIRTELASCGDFATFLLSIADEGALGEARIWKVLYELSQGLQHIHSNRFVHLDLKPSNILITQAGSLKIADFGMSLLVSSDGVVGGMSPALPQSDAAGDGGLSWGPDSTLLGPGADQVDSSGSEGMGMVPVPSPILDREVEGDREYLCPEALTDRSVGTPADLYSLGILLLETALNVVLPSNGDGWIKLRNDDFSDTLEHYLPRSIPRLTVSGSGSGSTTMQTRSMGQQADLPMLSNELMDVIKGLMSSCPDKRMKLDEIASLGSMKRMAGLVLHTETGSENADTAEGKKMTPALVDEGEWFLPYVLDG